jgi:parallel beta-helix repeat protein
MRSAATASLAIVGFLALAAAPARADIHDPVRDAITRRMDTAIGIAAHVQRRGIFAVRLAGVPAVVVSRDATLTEVHAAVPGAVRQPQPGVWDLDRLLVVTRGATLTIAAPVVRELRLLSREARFATLVGRRASLRFIGRRGRNLVVRSWDVTTGAPDIRLHDGRGSVSVRRGGRLDARDTSFEDLGFSAGRVSGVAATSPRRSFPPNAVSATLGTAVLSAAATDPPLRSRPTGTLVRSRFVRNMFGAYSYEAYGMRWIDNDDGFLVQGNLAAGNGRHGIIFSRFCDRNVIRRNRSIRNGWHGIVIDDGKHADGPSNGNVIAHNEVLDNAKVGISIDGSSHNVIVDNRVDHQRYGVRIFRRSFDNVVRGNRITRSADYGVFIDGARNTRVLENILVAAGTGARLRNARGSVLTANTLLAMRSHGVKIDVGAGSRPAGIVVADNRISGSGTSPILSAVSRDDLLIRGNREDWNYPLIRDVARTVSWYVGPGMWLLLLLAVVLGPLPNRIRRGWA